MTDRESLMDARWRLEEWLDDVQVGRYEYPQFKNPGELKAAIRTLLGELDTLANALEECARVSGADVSGGVPSWPPLHIWAVEEVKQLREDYDEAIS